MGGPSGLVEALLCAVVVTQVAIVATTVYLHRALAHRALVLHPSVTLVFRSLLWITTGIRPREWVAVHRRHHAKSDTVDDPHSPRVLGFWRVQLGNVGLYRAAAHDGVTVRRYARDLPPDRLDRALFDHALLGLALGIGILVAFTTWMGWGWQVGLLAAGIHAVSYLALSAAINAVGHTYGRRPHPNSATNMQSLALVTGGEGLHNNHHARPTSPTFALDGGLDPGWWVVRGLVALHLAELRTERVALADAA